MEKKLEALARAVQLIMKKEDLEYLPEYDLLVEEFGAFPELPIVFGKLPPTKKEN